MHWSAVIFSIDFSLKDAAILVKVSKKWPYHYPSVRNFRNCKLNVKHPLISHDLSKLTLLIRPNTWKQKIKYAKGRLPPRLIQMVPPPDSVSLNWQYLSGYQIAYGEIKQIWGVNGSSHEVHNPREKIGSCCSACKWREKICACTGQHRLGV